MNGFTGNSDPNRCNWGIGCASLPTEAILIHDGRGKTFVQGYCLKHADQVMELVKPPQAAEGAKCS